MARQTMTGHFVNRGKTDFKQTLSVNMHEITSDVHLHHIAGHGVVLAFFPDVFFEPHDAIMCASVLDTAVAVVDESALIHLMCVVIIKVMHYTVTKVGGKHFALFGVGDDKAR